MHHDARAYMAVVDCPAFLQAVADGNAGAVEEFHNDGVGRLNKVIPNCFDEKCIDAWGDGPVHWAVRKGRTDVLRKLIGRGWLVDENGRFDDTPLCVASEGESEDVAECINLLCIAGVRTEHGGASRVPPLLRAVALNHVQTAKALLIGGASLQSVHPETKMTAFQIATSDDMRDLLSNPPEVSPWNSTGLFKPPQAKSRQNLKSSAAWSSKRVKINHAAVSADSVLSDAPKMTEEEMEAALRAARAEARAKRRAAVQAEANLGFTMDDAGAHEASDLGPNGSVLPRVLDKAAVDRMASMIQVNVKKETRAFDDDASAGAHKEGAGDRDDQNDSACAPLVAASIETWGGLVMRSSETGCSIYAADFGFDAEASVIVEGRLPSKKEIPASVIDGIEESERLAKLQQTITNWMEKRALSVTDGNLESDPTDRGDDHLEAFSHRLTCSKQLCLALTSELLGDNCVCEEDASRSMCFVLQWHVHVSRSFLRQDGSCVTMSPIASPSDAEVLRSIVSGPAPTLAEMRAAPGSAHGAIVVNCFKSCDVEQWLVADADNGKALTFTVECSNISVDTVVLGSSTCLLHHQQTLQGLVAVRARGKAVETLLMQSSMLNDDDTPASIKYTIWKSMKPLQFKVGISSRAMLPNTCLRMLRCRAAPVTADEFPDEEASPDSAWPKLQEDNAELRAMWSDSVAVTPFERHSDSTGDFDWPSMPNPHVVQSQMQFGSVNLGVDAIGSQPKLHTARRLLLKPSVTMWRWRQSDMSSMAAPPWSPVDERADVMSAMEIEEGVNVTSMNDDEIECPLANDFVWHALTCEPGGAASQTAQAAALALSEALDKGGTPDDALAAFKAAHSTCEDLKFARWAACYFVNNEQGAAMPYKLPISLVSQASDIPYETTVLGQYRIGAVLPMSAGDAVRLFNTPCHIGPSLCLEPVSASKLAAGSQFSSAIFNPKSADGNCAQRVFLESGPDPNEVRQLKLLQAELTALEIELMDVVSHRAYKERGCTGDRELSWDSINEYLAAARRKEEELRARIAANMSPSKPVNRRKTGQINSHLQDELAKEHASLESLVLFEFKVCELRDRVYRLSEKVAKQHVIVWSRWSQSACAHTPPEPPFIDMPYSDAISCLGLMHGTDKSPLKPQKIFELPHFPRPSFVDPRLLEKTIFSKNKELPPHAASLAPRPPARPVPRCISPGPLDRSLDVHLANADDIAEATRLQEAALLSATLDVYTLPAALKNANASSPSRAASAASAVRPSSSWSQQQGFPAARSHSAAGSSPNLTHAAGVAHQTAAAVKSTVPSEGGR